MKTLAAIALIALLMMTACAPREAPSQPSQPTAPADTPSDSAPGTQQQGPDILAEDEVDLGELV